MKRLFILALFFILIPVILFIPWDAGTPQTVQQQPSPSGVVLQESKPKRGINLFQKIFAKIQVFNPLAIESMRKKKYPGSDIIVEKNLPPNSEYSSYIVSYKSEGLKIYGLLTIPVGQMPASGWPVIIFNHGYIPPKQYTSEGYYAGYMDAFSKSGYIVFKPDFRGNGSSEGEAKQSYISADYVTDDLNAISAVKTLHYPLKICITTEPHPSPLPKGEGINTSEEASDTCDIRDTRPLVNPDKIGVWGHSMGGNITLQDLVVSKDIKAAVIWSGVVGSYTDLEKWWNKRIASGQLTNNDKNTAEIIKKIFSVVGTPEDNPEFWQAVDPTNYVKDITAPLQLHVGFNDTAVPWEFSESLKNKLEKAGKTVEMYTYPGEDHNLNGPGFLLAVQRSVEFFDKHLKEIDPSTSSGL